MSLTRIAFFSALAMLGVSCLARDIHRVRKMKIENVDLAAVADGAYEGQFAYGGFTYVVQTTIASHRIARIDVVKNRDTSHAKMAEAVLPRVVESQSLEVDASTGATTTSKALLKAVEHSLSRGSGASR